MTEVSPRRGLLIAFEGAEGVGKTTQVQRLVAQLQARGVPHVHLREPGGTTLGEAVRALLLDPASSVTPAAEALLFLVSRAQLVADRIRPALDEGMVVIVDRFFLSTYAYQIAGRELDEAGIRAGNQLAVGGLVPDVTLLLDLPSEVGMTRAGSRGAFDRMEAAGATFHRRVAAAFTSFLDSEWQRLHPECGPIVRIDAAGREEDVLQRVLDALHQRWPDHFAALTGTPS